MSNQAPNWFTTQYDNRVTHEYQAQGNRLRPTVTMATRVEAAKATFWVAGKGTARKKLRGQRAVPMKPSARSSRSISRPGKPSTPARNTTSTA